MWGVMGQLGTGTSCNGPWPRLRRDSDVRALNLPSGGVRSCSARLGSDAHSARRPRRAFNLKISTAGCARPVRGVAAMPRGWRSPRL